MVNKIVSKYCYYLRGGGKAPEKVADSRWMRKADNRVWWRAFGKAKSNRDFLR